MEYKDVAILAAIMVVAIAAITGYLYAARLFSNAVTPITVQQVEPGVRCATMVTADGAAISCWETDAQKEQSRGR
jgi:hypothetical protein